MDYKIKTRPKIPRNKYGYLTTTSTGNGGTISTSSSSGGNSDYATNAEHATNADNALHANVADKATTADKLTNTVKIFGIDFDGSNNVNGNATIDGQLITKYVATFQSGILSKDDSEFETDVTVSGNVSIGGDLTVDESSVFNNVATFNEEITTNDVKPSSDNTYSLGTSTKRYKEINAVDGYLKNLTVTGSAHFFELIIDKIKSAGGSALFTPADGFVIDKVVNSSTYYTLYWKCKDENGNQRDNKWKVNDQALCMSFNQAKVGTTHQVANKYYWALVTATNGTSAVTVSGEEYNYIRISKTTKDGTLNPEVGDNIVMCGYRGSDDLDRGSAIYISAYDGLDSGIKAPFIAQYRGINDFNLNTHRQSYFDAQSAKFVGSTLLPENIANDSLFSSDFFNNTLSGTAITTYGGNGTLNKTKIDTPFSDYPKDVYELKITKNPSSANGYWYGSQLDTTKRVKVKTDTYYTFSVWVKSTTDFNWLSNTEKEIVECNLYSVENSVNNSDRPFRPICVIDPTSKAWYDSNRQRKNGIVAESDGWSQVSLSFKCPKGTYSTATYGDYAWFEWHPQIFTTTTALGNILYYGAWKLEEGVTPTELLTNTEKHLIDTGIDILNNKIVFTTNNLNLQNNDGETTMTVDKGGNLQTTGIQSSLMQSWNTSDKFNRYLIKFNNPNDYMCFYRKDDSTFIPVSADKTKVNAWADDSQVLPQNLGGNHNINGNYYSLDMIAAGGLIDIGYMPASVIDIVLPFMDSVSTTNLQPNEVLFVRTPTTMSNNTLHWITSKELKSLIGRRVTIANTCTNKYIGISNVWVVDGTYDINNNFIENSAEFKTIEIYPNESVTLEFQNITTVKSASKRTEAGDRYKVDLYYPKLCWKLVANANSFFLSDNYLNANNFGDTNI